MQKDSIIYVNFSPYENAGKVFDYLLEKFSLVALFSFSFHRLKNKKGANKLRIYCKGKLIETKSLFDYQFPEKLIFVFLPIRSGFIFLQILFYATYLRIKYGQFQYYFTVNAFTAWTGNILKKLGIVKKTIFWVWDYYPLFHQSLIIATARWTYWQFDKLATKSNTLIFLNERIAQLRKEVGELDKNIHYKIIPIGTNIREGVRKLRISKSKMLNFVFMGVVKKSQGLDLLFNNSEELLKEFPKICIHVVGAGPDLNYFKKRAISSPLKVIFHEYLEDEKCDRILKKCDIGIATYIPGKDNVSYYGDPSKIKQYLSFGLPVITTDVFDFSREIKNSQAGIIINYDNPQELVKALRKIITKYTFYSNNAISLAKKYSYRKIYPEFFR
jgi:glycosyltransferase involved in cell wall biosynthesis